MDITNSPITQNQIKIQSTKDAASIHPAQCHQKKVPVNNAKRPESEKTLSTHLISQAEIVSNYWTDREFKTAVHHYDVLMNPADMVFFCGHKKDSSRYHLFINEKPYTVTACSHLNRDQIAVPPLFKDNFNQKSGEPVKVQLSTIPIKIMPKAFKSVEVTISSIDGQELKDASGQRLFLDRQTVLDSMEKLCTGGFIFDVEQEYPIKLVVCKPEPICSKYRAKSGEIREFILTVLPTAAAFINVQTFACLDSSEKDKGTSEDSANDSEKDSKGDHISISKRMTQQYTRDIEQLKKEKYFIYNSKNSPKYNTVLKDKYAVLFEPNDLVVDPKAIEGWFKESSKMDGHNVLALDPMELKDIKRVLIKVNNFYYYAGPFSSITVGYQDCAVNRSFKKNHKIDKKMLYFIERENKVFHPAKKVEVSLNWILSDRKKVPFNLDELKQKVRTALIDVPLQNGRYFQVKIKPDMQRFDENGQLNLFHNGKHVTQFNFILEGKIEQVDGDCISGSLGSEDVYQIDQQTELKLTSVHKAILDGSEPNIMDVDSYLPLLTERLIGMESYAREIIQRIIIPRLLFQSGKRDTYNKGIILHGPPGNGKSVLAYMLANAFNIPDANIHMVQAGSIISRDPETSISNLQKVFAPALRSIENEYAGQLASLHIFLLDEFDCIFIPESSLLGRSESQQAVMGVFNTIMSSQEEYNNIICIGTTNRDPDHALDKSLIREGRISEVIPIDNPDFKTRKYMVRYVVEQHNPVATIDQDTLESVADILMSNANSKSVIELVNQAKEQALISHAKQPEKQTEKQPLKLEFKHFHQVVFLPRFIEEFKLKQIASISKFGLGDYTIYENQKTQFKQYLTPLTRGLGKALICGITAEKGAMIREFLYDSLNEINGFTDYYYLDGHDSVSTNTKATKLLAKIPPGARRLIVINYAKAFINSFRDSNEPCELGILWQSVLRNRTANIALVIVAETRQSLPDILDLMGLTHNIGVYEELNLPNTFNHEQMKQHLQETYPSANPEAIAAILSVFPDRYQIEAFKKLVNHYHVYKEGISTWDVTKILNKIEKGFSLQALNSCYVY